jgi:glyoxylase-like metal-dependent hydrolase (beta-lactamase superfamily II)
VTENRGPQKATPMLSWTIGAVKVTRIVELEMPVPYSTSRPFLVEATPEALREHAWLFPNFVTKEGHLRFSIHALLVEAPGIRLVVDTCVGNDRPRGMTGGVALATGFLKSFADAGWTREGVDAVVCTHLHVDHVGWNTMLVDGAWVRGRSSPTPYSRSSTLAWRSSSTWITRSHQSCAWSRPQATRPDTSAWRSNPRASGR